MREFFSLRSFASPFAWRDAGVRSCSVATLPLIFKYEKHILQLKLFALALAEAARARDEAKKRQVLSLQPEERHAMADWALGFVSCYIGCQIGLFKMKRVSKSDLLRS